MKNLLICTLFLFVLGSCKDDILDGIGNEKIKAETIEDFKCLMQNRNQRQELSYLRKAIRGTWQLKASYGGWPGARDHSKVDNVVLKIGRESLIIGRNGEIEYDGKYSVREVQKYGYPFTTIVFIYEVQRPDAKPYSIEANVQVCDGELLLDYGGAGDGFAYLYRKK